MAITAETFDSVGPLLLARMAATLGCDPPRHELPPLWHWMLFQEWAPRDRTGADGHPERGGFLPDLPRRMWAGSRIHIHGPLHAGDTLTRTSTVGAINQRMGRSGRLVFVTMQHDIARDGRTMLTEAQDLVYREAAAAAPARPAGDAHGKPPAGRIVRPDEVMLFRYSALTGNSHRIHYDAPFATGVEQYPGLVVHGPLVATLLMELLRCEQPETTVRHLAIRALRPAFAGRDLHLTRRAQGASCLLDAFNSDGETCMTIEASG